MEIGRIPREYKPLPKDGGPVWNVIVHDINYDQFISYNVFRHVRFSEDIKKGPRKGQDFDEWLRCTIMYYFWSKCEYEIILSPWPPHENDKDLKIDVYDQLMVNYHRFREYVLTLVKPRFRKAAKAKDEAYYAEHEGKTDD